MLKNGYKSCVGKATFEPKPNCMQLLSRALPLALFLTLSAAAGAQRNWRPAFLVNRAGDTLRGEIDDRKWSLVPTTIAFRGGPGEAAVEYGVQQLNGFALSEGDFYAVEELPIDEAPLELNNLADITEDRTTVRRVFLRRLYEGRLLSLFELQEPSKTHYVLRDSTGRYTELQYRLGYVAGTREVETRRGFRNQLFVYVPDPQSRLAAEVRSAEYNAESLLNLFPHLNSENSLSRRERNRRIRGIRLQVFAGGGIVLNEVTIHSTRSLAQTPPGHVSTDPLYTVGIELSEKARLQHFFLRLGFAYSSFSYSGDVQLPTTTLHYEGRNIRTYRNTVSLHYQHRLGRLQAFLGPGVAYEYTRIEYTNIAEMQEYRGLVPQLGAGLRFGRIFLAADYRFPSGNRFLSGPLFYAGFTF